MRNFFAELKRRKVYRVAIAYIVAGWVLAQVVTQIFPVFEVPNWAMRLIILLLIIGFPVALILAWAFDITPQGIVRTEDIEPKTGRLLGNFPQAYTHVGLIHTAVTLGELIEARDGRFRAWS